MFVCLHGKLDTPMICFFELVVVFFFSILAYFVVVVVVVYILVSFSFSLAKEPEFSTTGLEMGEAGYGKGRFTRMM